MVAPIMVRRVKKVTNVEHRKGLSREYLDIYCIASLKLRLRVLARALGFSIGVSCLLYMYDVNV